VTAEESVPAGAPNKFELRRAATRAGLLQLGLGRFPTKGYSATTIDDIVRGSDYTRGAFYFHFAGKEEFFLHVLQARADLRDQWWLAVREAGVVDAQSGVVAALARLRDQTDGHPWLLLIADFSQAATGHHEYTEPLQALYRQWITEIASFVREMRVRGFVRDGLADDAVAEQVFATAQGYTLHRAVYGIAGQGLVDALVRILQP
jgi:AcrR family transcriptional regulator